MAAEVVDPLVRFYERHPYPPPVAHLDALVERLADGRIRRQAHHLIWPERPVDAVRSILVAGCGTAQAVRHALRRPEAHVVEIDLSSSSLQHTRALAEHHGVKNLEVFELPIEEVGSLEAKFDHIVCTGVLHHLADPGLGLAALRSVLAPGGAITLMVYARAGRVGVRMIQDYCRRLGVVPEEAEIADLVATLREMPVEHPLSPLLRKGRDFLQDGAMADALLNPREQTYSVAEILDLVDRSGLRFGRWTRQAPYLADCGSISETPHAARLAAMPDAEQFVAIELFRGTLTRHSLIVFAAEDARSGVLDFAVGRVDDWVPIPVSTALVVQERLPPGAAAALLNQSHSETDLVFFVDQQELEWFQRIDGTRSVRELGSGAGTFVERLWRHDLVVIDASGARDSS